MASDARLPAARVAALPAARVAALPAAWVAALPAAWVAALPAAWVAALLAAALACLATAGCREPEPPPRVTVGGTVTIEGKPVPRALVTFYPLFEGFGGELIAEGVTDSQGKYSVTCPIGGGACLGRHKVTVTDAPMPEDARDQSVAAQRRMQTFLASLTNRPIGTKFGTLATTPLEVEVTATGESYDLKVTH